MVFRWVNGGLDNSTPAAITFRQDGEVLDGSLELQLSDFCHEGVLSGDSDLEDPFLSISHSDLDKFILQGHELERNKDDPSSLLPYIQWPPVRATYPDRNLEDLPSSARPKRPASSSDSDIGSESEPYSRPADGSEGRLRKVARGEYAEAETSDPPEADGAEATEPEGSHSGNELSDPPEIEDEPGPAETAQSNQGLRRSAAPLVR